MLARVKDTGKLADLEFRIDYTQQLPVTVPEMTSVEQTLNMSPMDLFDSIFWGKPFVCCVVRSGRLIAHRSVPNKWTGSDRL